MFWIGFTDEKLGDASLPAIVGRLKLSYYEESFISHLLTWDEEAYYLHWHRALTRVLSGKPAALVTDMRPPDESQFLVWWPMWRIEENIVFHNQIFLYKEHGISRRLDILDLYEYIGSRRQTDLNGREISEWVIPILEIEQFLQISDAS